jgi:ArsR family transcriptional regulator, arsenate/arsenite/antimonite-responsive transcriptional repressor
MYDRANLHTGATAMDNKAVLAGLAALAHESRLAVFRLLVEAAPVGLAASKIAEHLDIPASSLSFHLKELSHAGLLSSRQDGRFVIYSANMETMNGLIGFLTQNCCAGVPCDVATGAACMPAQTSDCGATRPA